MLTSKSKSKYKELFDKIGLNLSLNIGFLRANINFQDSDKKAAWELYVEMLTRIVTQELPNEYGDEKTALDSIFSLFPTTRDILKKYGRKSIQFSKIAIPVLNQIIRPFTAKWHKLSIEDCFKNKKQCKQFRQELNELQLELKKYNRLLADIAGVEDLTDLENTS